MFEIKCEKKNEILKLNQFWLRDHCRCLQCYNQVTKQRKYNLLDLPEDIAVKDWHNTEDGKLLKVKWNDGHCSEYDLDFIYNSQMDNIKLRNDLRMPWKSSEILSKENDLKFKLSHVVSSEDCVKSLVKALVQYGIVFIEQVPANTTMTEMAIRRIFPIMKTFFGEMFTFSDAPDHADTAYSKDYLGPHTDNTYFCDAAGLQVLHCLQHLNGTGGENFFIDGLNAAYELKNFHPEFFDILTKVSIPAEYIETGQYHKHSAPLIRTDSITGDIIQLRLNVYDRAMFNTLPQRDMQKFYESFRKFLQIIQNPANKWCMKLQPGTIVIFDNWRVYHGRHSYTGHRTMTGCYVQRTDFRSKARVLGIID
uniref:Trimethyllysine dioxygenase, mitochondrial n=1 Tax=Glossina brevipalpis TaxID=37001 RepID=A0A1A9X281_9MUSC